MTHLESLRKMSTVVADTGDIEAIAKHKPVDATTNPSLLLKAAPMPKYRHLLDDAIGQSGKGGDKRARVTELMDRLAVAFGCEILSLIPGRVSTEVDAALSFDTEGTMAKARRLVKLYEQAGVARERILIKVASTWEGIRAAEQLEREGIHTNLTLLFSLAQAVACADARVTLISPFVGRIYDWYKKQKGVDDLPIEDDPGVRSVERIYTYFKKHDFATQVMGASFRKATQVIALAGCDLLTISPEILEELERTEGELEQRLTVAKAKSATLERMQLDEKTFRWLHNEDAMASDKLAEGIRVFNADARKLEAFAATELDKAGP